MKSYFLLLSVLFVLLFDNSLLFSQAPNVVFQKTIGGSINEEAYSVIPTDDGGYMLGGWTNSDDGFVTRTPLSQGTAQDTYFIKLNSFLQKQWNYSPTTPSVSYGSDFGFSFIKTADGGFISSGNSANEEIVIIKINSNGGLVWEKSYLSRVYGSFKSQIIQTQDGGYLVVAENYIYVGYNKIPNILLLKISSDGTTEWTKTYGGSDSDFVAGLTQTNDGNFVIASYSYSSDGDVGSNNGGSDAWIFKVGSFGNIIWKKKYGTHNNEVINGICATNDGGVAVCGKVFSNTPSIPYSDFLVYKLNINGDLDWSSVFGSTFSDLAESITESNSGGFLISGSVGIGNYEQTASSGNATNLKGKEDLWIVKLGVTGNLLWEKTLGGSDNDIGYFVKELPNSDILVAGRTQSTDEDISDYNGGGGPLRGGDMWLVKLGFNVKSINTQAFYAPNSNVKINSICPGGNLDLKVKLEGYNNQLNTFKIQLSDFNGNFTNPITLSTINSSSNFLQNIIIPSNISYGKYKIRVIDDVNNVISYNSRTLIINSNLPSGEIYEGSTSVAKGSTVTIKARFTGIAPWNFTINEGGGVSTVISNNSTNPYIFNRVVNNSKSFTLSSVSNQCGVGTTSGQADIRMTYGGLKVADINHYIANVKLCDFKGNQLDNTSTNQLGDYSNLPPLSLQKGIEYTLKSTVYSNYYFSGTTTSYKIYVDINKDTSFTANELIYSTSQVTTSAGNNFIGNVFIPASAIDGLTRLRIVTQNSQYSNYNDVEDYAINIFSSSSPTITLGEIANNSLNIICAGSSYSIDFRKYNFSSYNYTYQIHLSDKNGVFTNSIPVGNGQSSPISITIPNNTEVGTNFRLKLSAVENSLINSIKCGNFSVNKSPTATISISSDTILLNGNLQLSAILTGGEPYSFNVSGGVTTVPSTNSAAFALNYNNTVTKPTNYQITSLSNTCGVGSNSNIASLRKVIKYCMPKFDFRLIRKFSMSQGNINLISYADLGNFYPDPLFNKNNVILT
jgi:GEVED domain